MYAQDWQRDKSIHCVASNAFYTIDKQFNISFKLNVGSEKRISPLLLYQHISCSCHRRPLGVARRSLIESSVYSGHQVAGINGLPWRCVAKPALLYAHFWPVQAHADADQQLSAATGLLLFLHSFPHRTSLIHAMWKVKSVNWMLLYIYSAFELLS